jgi:FixJ family two-component response regulator
VSHASPTIAVIDDDESVRRALRRLLRSTGLAVVTFATAEAFLEDGSQPPPDCLVLDVRLPGLSGLELQQRLAAAGRHIPIVFITAHEDEQTRRQALAAGALEFLAKPFHEEVLLDALTVALGRKDCSRDRQQGKTGVPP